MPPPYTDEDEQDQLAVPQVRRQVPQVQAVDPLQSELDQLRQRNLARQATLAKPMPEASGARRVAGTAVSVLGSLINPAVAGFGQQLLHPGLTKWQQERENAKSGDVMDEAQMRQLESVSRIQDSRAAAKALAERQKQDEIDRLNTRQQSSVERLMNPNTYGGEIIPNKLPDAPAAQRLMVPGQPISPSNLPNPGIGIPGATPAEQFNPATGKKYGEEGTIQEIRGAKGTEPTTVLVPNQATRQERKDTAQRAAAKVKREEAETDMVPVTADLVQRFPGMGLTVGDKITRAERQALALHDTTKNVPAEQQFLDEYKRLHPQATIAEAQHVYHRNIQAPPQPTKQLMMVPDGNGGYVAKEITAGTAVPEGAINASGMNTQNVATSATRTMKEAAPKVMAMADRIGTLIDAQAATLGPLSSRWAEFMAGKVGAPNAEFTKLRTDVGLLSTMLLRMHVGARGGELMMQHFKDLIDVAKQSPENLKAALGEIKLYADEVAGHPKPTGQPPTPESGRPVVVWGRDAKGNPIPVKQ